MLQNHSENIPLLSRKHWAAACQFHDRTADQLLEELLQRIQSRDQPLVLFDLDSTLYEVGPRTFQIIQDWTETPESRSAPGFRDWLRELCETQVRYSVPETLEEAFEKAILSLEELTWALNLTVEDRRELVSQVHRFWFRQFFTNDYLIYDRVYPGAVEFVQKIHQTGAEVVYLTGRDRPNMGRGTIENLLRDGLPWNSDKTRLLMKPKFDMPDLEFKLGATQEITSRGDLVASFENEPPNVVALYRQFPTAMHIFVDTVCGPHAAPTCTGLYRMSGWKKISNQVQSC